MTDNRDKRRQAQARKRENLYKKRLKFLKKIGAYNPKTEELTKYRRTQINKRYAKWEQYDTKPGKGKAYHQPDKYFFVDATKNMSKGRTKRFLENAKQMNMVTTPKGVFIAKEGQRRATVKYSAKRNEFDIHLTGKVKKGERKGKAIHDVIPVAPVGKLDQERKRLKDMGSAFGPMKGNERISFIVSENGVETGASRNTYKTIDMLIEALERYEKSMPARLEFYRHIMIRKTTMLEWSQLHPSKQTAKSRLRRKRKQR